MAIIVDALASQFADTIATLVKDEVMMMIGAKAELRQLEKKLRTIRNVLEDAERRAFTDSAVRAWLAELKDVVYDADDVIDHCRTHAEQFARLSSDKTVHCYSPLLSFFRRVAIRHRTGSSIRSINERLANIAKEQSEFSLIGSAPSDDGGSSRIRRQTDSILESDIVGTGIENDTIYLVELLTKSLDGPAIQVVAIVGMGGIGKTTLAQKIYNHQAIRENFPKPPPVWICVSKDYDDNDILRRIIRLAGGGVSEGSQSFEELQLLLTDTIEGKKVFIVLDDVWNSQVWEHLLRKSLQKAANGSRVLVSTRDEHVAKQMGAIHLHNVRPLTTDEGWSLLCKMVFENPTKTEGVIELVEDIGIQIVERCGGLPLAIKTIAGVLKTKDNKRSEWERVLENPAWSLTDLPTGVMGVLYLSYQDLPFHLKQCFIFCSVFPEDEVFMRHTLIQYWVAEGFAKDQGSMIAEEVAQCYYKELLRRSLLQADPQYYDYGGCSMHDLLRSLAQYLSRDENFIGDVNGLGGVASAASIVKLRHVYIVDHNLNSIPEVLKEQRSLRTLLLDWLDVVEEDVFKKLQCLRVLDLSTTNLTRLPESIGNLVHLRYLDLCHCPIEELPDSIGSLGNLQYLILQRCMNMRKLPKGVARLYNLRSLDILHTPVNGMPMGIRKLLHMNRLMGFVTNESIDGGWCSLQELASLSQLRALTLNNLENALIRTEPLSSRVFEDIHHLTKLELSCAPWGPNGEAYGDAEVNKIQQLFDNVLAPPPTLEKFKIDSFFGLQFPSWLMSDVPLLLNLRKFDLVNCRFCQKLPPLGHLPILDNLDVVGAYAVERIGREFMGTSGRRAKTPFPKLGKLKLKDMPNLVEWLWEDSTMPRLWSLKIIKCRKLSSLPSGIGHAKSLTTLLIDRADSLTSIEGLVNLRHLFLSENPNLSRISNLTALQTMKVEDCPALVDVKGLYSLQSLDLEDVQMGSLPEWLMLEEGTKPAFSLLEKLDITVGGSDVLYRCYEGGLDWPKIRGFPLVQMTALFTGQFLLYRRDACTLTTNLDVGGGSKTNDGADDQS